MKLEEQCNEFTISKCLFRTLVMFQILQRQMLMSHLISNHVINQHSTMVAAIHFSKCVLNKKSFSPHNYPKLEVTCPRS
jgi:hypothetical protein